MQKSLLSLFDVLTEEYKHQAVKKPLDEKAEKHFQERREHYAAQFAHLDESLRGERIDKELVADFYKWLHKDGDKRAAICFSGGGIRSATFALGVLQGLARNGIKLGQFHFLSTVSGGGYIGSWLSAWIHRQGMARVQEELSGTTEEDEAGNQANPNKPGQSRKHSGVSPANPEPETVRHLRSYSRYMSPSFSLLSADTWTLVGIYLRNLLLNWSVLIPLMLGVLAIPRLAMALVAWENPPGWLPGVALLASLLCGGWATGYIITNRPSLTGSLKGKRGAASPYRKEAWFLVLCLLPLWLSAIAASAFWVWSLNLNDVANQNDMTAAVAKGLEWWTDRAGFLNSIRQLPMWLCFALFGTLFHLLGFVISRIWVRVGGWDLAFSVITGFLGGACLYLVTMNFFTSPIKESSSAASAAALFTCFAAPVFLLTFLMVGTLYTGLASYITSDADREWLARAGGWMLIAILVWAVICALVILAPQALLSENEYWGAKMKSLLTSLGIGSGALTLFGGKSEETDANKKEAKKKEEKGPMAKSIDIGLSLAAPLFAAFILVMLSLISTLGIAGLCTKLTAISSSGNWQRMFFSFGDDAKNFFTQLGSSSLWQNLFADQSQYHWRVLFHTPSRVVFWSTLVVVGVGVLMGFFININGFSLHAAYRDRLVRAYLGASRSSRERFPNPFTGLDERDNLQMHELTTDLYYSDSFKQEKLRALIGKLAGTEAGGKYHDVSALVWDQFPEPTKKLLQAYVADETTDDERKRLESLAKQSLADGFNRLLQGVPLPTNPAFSPEEQAKFARVFDQVRQDFMESVGCDEGSEELMKQLKRLQLNRMILDQAFEGEIENLQASLKRSRPLHIVNIALNLVGGEELAWQDRKAQSFTISSLHSGSYNLGYRHSYGYALNNKRIRRLMSDRPISAIGLGTSLAISGAAASPNMGYHSSSVVTFLLALFNVRLGWWLGNPGKAGNTTYQMPSPTFAPYSLIAETFGRTNADHAYVYLSDGGHFENLALYEMILRRCHLIVLSDASADGDFAFEDLGSAVRKIQIDQGVPIEFKKGVKIRPRLKAETLFTKDGKDDGGQYCAVAEINYKAVDGDEAENGWLLYLKPTICGSEPPDVLNYAKANPTFPHETTGDQMYSESQFESYRSLGEYVIESICEKKENLDLDGLFDLVKEGFGLGRKAPTNNEVMKGVEGDAG